MPQESVLTNDKEVQDEFQKLTSLFNEEIYVRVNAENIPVTKFKIYDDLIQIYTTENKLEDANKVIKEHLENHPDSISARYMTGLISLIQNKLDESSHLKTVLEQLKLNGKWVIIEYVADKILQFGEQRLALKFKAEALEKLNKTKELKPVLEKLARHDRKNPEIAKKYALSIIDEDETKAIGFLKQAAESFARSKDYSKLEEIWTIIVQKNFEDIAFFEKIERILLANRERSRLVILLLPIMETYKSYEEHDKTIYFLKKILDSDPFHSKARNELIKAYRAKYENHSLLEEFLRLSEIGNSKKPIKACISNFERNIVFDTNNYVMHRNWGVGKIKSISSESDSIVVDFSTKKEHKLSIQMAITSLKPLKKDHIWVKLFETPDEIQKLFQEDVANFMVELLTSYDNIMILNDIKAEIVGRFIQKTEDWSKWWNKAKLALKKDPRIGFNPKKKDEIIFRQKPISLTEELTDKFNAQTDANKKLDIALEALEVYQEAEGAVESFNHFYYEEEEAKETPRRIVAYIYLDFASSKVDPDDLPRHIKPDEIKEIIKNLTKDEILQYSKSISNIEVKKSFVNLIKKYHPNFTENFIELLYEVPVKANKYIFSQLVTEGKYDELNKFLENVLVRSKENPEIFLWVAKSIASKTWDYKWMKIPEKDLLLRVFRILKPLVKIEEKGTKMKNMATDILFGNPDYLHKVITEETEEFVRKLYALFKEVPYITDNEKEKFQETINKLRPNFTWNVYSISDDEETDEYLHISPNVILVTQNGFNTRKEVFNHLVNVEMLENSKDIGEAQEKGDLRENAEYKAAMERQQQLQAEVTKMDAELKSARIIDFSKVLGDRISVGAKVKLKDTENNEISEYSILGPWDADTEKNIISYLSPMGKALIGKRKGEIANLDFENSHKAFEVLEISRYSI
ncbi:MAG: transcription elongation factor GreA [Leptospiraceae bacterium]|nr:transcription elongation factor GreA [Leptospiraceae bacterium]MCP5511655.1 transcription elongation factor GreA [Leptospiraceae bacterium]